MDKRIQIILFFFLIILDQALKFYFFEQGHNQLNVGISFGWGESASQPFLLFFLTTILFLLPMLLTWQKTWHWWWILFFAGATSNLIDRLIFKGVRDILPIPGTNLNNNLADYFIMSAVLMPFIIRVYRDIKERNLCK